MVIWLYQEILIETSLEKIIMKTKKLLVYLIILLLICAASFGCSSNSSPISMPELYIPMSGNDLPVIEYSIELKNINDLPKVANVYKFIKNEQDASLEVLSIAKLFDISANSSDINNYDDYVIFGNGKYLIDYEIPTGMWSIRNIMTNTNNVANNLPSDAEAIEIARSFLIEKGLYDERFVIETVVTQYSGSELNSTYSPCFKTVYFYPIIEDYTILGVSRIIVKIDSECQIAELMKYYKDIELFGEIELELPTVFIDGIKNNMYSSSIRSDALSAKIVDVKLGYWEDAGSLDEQPYLQPIWIFIGESANADGTISDFDVIVQAAKNIDPLATPGTGN